MAALLLATGNSEAGEDGAGGSRLAGDAVDAFADAVTAATAAAALLLGGTGPAAPSQLQTVQQGLLHAEQALAAQLVADATHIDALLYAVQQQHAAACRLPGGDSSQTLSECLARLCAQYPLATPECAAQLLADATAAEARCDQQLQECRAAWRAFRASARRQLTAQVDRQRSAEREGAAVLPGWSSAGTSPRRCSSAGGGWPAESGSELALGLATARTDDGWAPDEHTVFERARCLCMAPGGGSEAALLLELAAQLPGRSAEQVRAHAAWRKEDGRLRAAVGRLEAGWRCERTLLECTAAARLAESEAGRLAAAGAAVVQLEAAAASLLSAATLDEQRTTRADQEASGFEQRWAAAGTLAERRAAERLAAERHRARMLQLLSEHRQRQGRSAAAAAAAERAAAAAAVGEARAAAAADAQRVQHRREMLAAKQARQELAQQRCKRVEQQREAALAALRAGVAPTVARDTARAAAPTQSSAAAAAEQRQQYGLFARALSFTTEALLRDRRFQVGEQAPGRELAAMRARAVCGWVFLRRSTSLARASTLPALPLRNPRRCTKCCVRCRCMPHPRGGKPSRVRSPLGRLALTCSPPISGWSVVARCKNGGAASGKGGGARLAAALHGRHRPICILFPGRTRHIAACNAAGRARRPSARAR